MSLKYSIQLSKFTDEARVISYHRHGKPHRLDGPAYIRGLEYIEQSERKTWLVSAGFYYCGETYNFDVHSNRWYYTELIGNCQYIDDELYTILNHWITIAEQYPNRMQVIKIVPTYDEDADITSFYGIFYNDAIPFILDSTQYRNKIIQKGFCILTKDGIEQSNLEYNKLIKQRAAMMSCLSTK